MKSKIYSAKAFGLLLVLSIFLAVIVNAETVPPTWSNNQVNSTVAGQPALFSVLANDETALQPNGQYTFSTNNTGTWINDSAGSKGSFFGYNSIGSSSDNLGANGLFGSYFNLSEASTITSISAYTHYSTGMMFAIYDSSQNLVVNSSTFVTSSAAAWNTRNLSVSLPAGSYWLIGYYNASPQLPYIYYTSSSVPAVWTTSGTFPNIPHSISSITKTTRSFSIYANYTTGSGGKFTTTPQSINSTKILNSTLGYVIGYQWYFTDNSSNINSTGIFAFAATSGPDTKKPTVSLNDPADNYGTSVQTIIFNTTTSDNIGLANISLYGNWTGAWMANQTNVSPVNGTPTTFTIDNLPEGKYIWNVLACDNSSNCAFSTTNRTFTIDNTGPSWSSNNTNSTTSGQAIRHQVHWEDNTALSGYIFSFDNGTGNFVNDSFVGMTGASNWSNVTKVVNFTNNSAIRWQVWANDTSNNWNSTDVFTYYTVSFSYPKLGFDVIYPTEDTSVSQNRMFNISFNVTCLSGECGTVNVSLINSGGTGQVTGLNFPGSSGVTNTMSFRFLSPISYPATYIWRVYPKQQDSYYTAFFYGNSGSFEGNNDYYGFHPYPDWAHSGMHLWEIASPPGGDWTGNTVINDQWYQQAAVVYKFANGSTYNIFYYNWPDTTQNITHIDTTPRSPPSSPIINVADAPWNQGNEEWNGYMRDFQFYNGTLNNTQIAQEISSPGSVQKPWYLNINPTPTDISDKSGNGNNPSWVGNERPALWSANTTQSGLIPSGSGNPFYTNSTNPITTSPLSYGQSQIVTFWINATGNTNTSYSLFAFANMTSNQSVSNVAGIGNITIQQSMTAPVITTQPQPTVQETEGTTATFSVAATGNPNPSYQWQGNGTNISGANSKNYTTPALTMGDNGTVYDVLVYNSEGSVVSNSSLLIVNPLPLLQITNPTGANPINVSSNQNVSLYFNILKNGNPVTSGVGIPMVIIGNNTANVISIPYTNTSNNYQPSVVMSKTTDTTLSQPPSFSSAWNGSNASQSCYNNITSSNNIYCRLSSTTSNADVWLRMNFTIPENLSTITSIKITAEGGATSSSSTEDLAFIIANFSSNSWKTFGSDTKTETTRTITYTNGFGSIVKNGQLVLLFEGSNLDSGESIFIDYVNVQVNTSSGGYQQFGYTPSGWQVNVTAPTEDLGSKDLTVSSNYNGTLLNSTETNSVIYV